MRKILLLTILMIECCFPSFSQFPGFFRNNQVRSATTHGDYSLRNGVKTFSIGDSIGFKGLLALPRDSKKILCPKLAEKYLRYNRKPLGVIKRPGTIDDMPVYKPKGNFSMQIYEPDSTTFCTLLIKED